MSMSPERKKEVVYQARLLLLIVYACAYVSGVVVFFMVYDNYWASGGFAFVIALICIRIWMYVLPDERLYMMFPAMSWKRGVWQGFWFAGALGGIGLGLWLFARGLQERQNWTGDSYFCSMTGLFMAAKWCINLTLPMYHLRPDIMEEETLLKLRNLMKERGEASPLVETEAVADPSSPGPRKDGAECSAVERV